MKNIVICFDGTWNTADALRPTNVVQTAKLVAPCDWRGITQVVHYDSGVGTAEVLVAKHLESVLGGAFGKGLMTIMENAYRFLIFNYAPGDRIFVFGFSRGAFTARSFVGLIRNCGILAKDNVGLIKKAFELYQSRDPKSTPWSEESKAFRDGKGLPGCVVESDDERQRRMNGTSADKRVPITIEYLGIWDTVGELGIPKDLLLADVVNEQYRFHDDALSSMVLSARHALAIDEMRDTYQPTLWKNIGDLNKAAKQSSLAMSEPPYVQLWFPGDHCSVGGGSDFDGLWQASLVWVVEGAMLRGLAVDTVKLNEYRHDIQYTASTSSTKEPSSFSWTAVTTTHSPRRWPEDADQAALSEWAIKRYKESPENLAEKQPYRPKTLERLEKFLSGRS